MTTDHPIAERVKIDRILAIRDEAIENARAMFAASEAIERCFKEIDRFIDPSNLRGMSDARKRIDSAAWHYVLERCGLATLMDEQRRGAFLRELERSPQPFERDTVTATFETLFAQRQEIFADGVVSLFRRLDHKYRRHDSFKLSHRIIVERTFECWSERIRCDRYTFGYSSYGGVAPIADLYRVCLIVKGLPVPKNTHDAVREHFKANTDDGREPGPVQFPGFTIKGHKNGNAHITLDADMVDQLNRIIASRNPGAVPHDRRNAA